MAVPAAGRGRCAAGRVRVRDVRPCGRETRCRAGGRERRAAARAGERRAAVRAGDAQPRGRAGETRGRVCGQERVRPGPCAGCGGRETRGHVRELNCRAPVSE